MIRRKCVRLHRNRSYYSLVWLAGELFCTFQIDQDQQYASNMQRYKSLTLSIGETQTEGMRKLTWILAVLVRYQDLLQLPDNLNC